MKESVVIIVKPATPVKRRRWFFLTQIRQDDIVPTRETRVFADNRPR
jgi:hypothetical protein